MPAKPTLLRASSKVEVIAEKPVYQAFRSGAFLGCTSDKGRNRVVPRANLRERESVQEYR